MGQSYAAASTSHSPHSSARSLVGRPWDLSKAYKRLATFPGHRAVSVIAVRRPSDGAVVFFEHLPLAFGGRMNVLSFNAVSRALCFILVVGLGVPIEHYFDDFPTAELTIKKGVCPEVPL